MSRHCAKAALDAGLAAGLVGLAGCGRQGDLDRPGPLWGAKAKADWQAAHRPPATNAPASNGIPPLPPDDTEDNSAPNGPPTPP